MAKKRAAVATAEQVAFWLRLVAANVARPGDDVQTLLARVVESLAGKSCGGPGDVWHRLCEMDLVG